MTNELIPQPRVQELHTILDRAKAVEIIDANSNQLATDFQVLIKTAIKDIKEFYEADIKNAKKTYDGLKEKRDSWLEPFEIVEKQIIVKMKIYRAKLDAEAAEISRKERERLEAIERERIEAERKIEREKAAALEKELADKRAAEAAEKRKISEAEAKKRDEEQAAIQKEIDAANAKAEVLEKEKAAVNIQPIETPKIETAKSQSWRDNWKFRVVNIKEVPRAFMVVNEEMLKDIAKSTKGTAVVPGIEFWNDKTPVVYSK